MSIRHDLINLHTGVDDKVFETFVADELIPFFTEHYKGPTRASKADLKWQSLIKSTHGSGHYIWVTAWDGSPEEARGSSFENTRMITIEGTAEILAKLATFGSRSGVAVFFDLIHVSVPTNV